MSTNSDLYWKSVRPVRFRSQIFGALECIKMEGKVSMSELAKHSLSLRNSMEEKRLQALGRRKSIGPGTKDLHRQPYLTETEQLIRVLRSTGFVRVDKTLISGTELAQELLAKKSRDELDADAFFLERLFDSRFLTYWLFLKQLFISGKAVIPKAFSKRDRNLREYLETQGFPLSVWTFYIIRDLFYDFGLLNYVIENFEERIFPLYSLDRQDENKYAYKIRSANGLLYYWKKVTMEQFEKAVAQSYLEIVGRWDKIADMVELRERVSERLEISERQFNLQLENAVRHPAKVKMYPSVGALSSEKRKGYMTKVLSLPTSERGYPLTLIRISQAGVGHDKLEEILS